MLLSYIDLYHHVWGEIYMIYLTIFMKDVKERERIYSPGGEVVSSRAVRPRLKDIWRVFPVVGKTRYGWKDNKFQSSK